MKKISILMLGVLLVSTAFAQPQKGSMQMRKPRMGRQMPHQRGEFSKPEQHERMEKMMAYKMTEDLDLTTKQAEKFFPMLKEHQEIMNKIDEEMLKATEDVHKKVKNSKKITDKEFEGTIEKVHLLEKSKIDEKARHITELKGVLDNTQRAKFVTFKHRFARGVEDRLRMKRAELGKEKKRLERKRKNLEEYKEQLNELDDN